MVWSVTRNSRSESGMHFYQVFGLTVESEWELQQLPSVEPTEGADIRIVRAALDTGPEGISPTLGGSLLVISSVARYRISGGNLIEIDAAPGVSARNVELYLLGSAIGAVLHQRKMLPLHANAIDLGGAAVVFMGHSGAGKSTLAAWFHDRGYPVLADDICPVDLSSGEALVHPGIPRLRLWREALEHSGRSALNYEMSFDDYEKYDVPTELAVSPARLPIIAAYELARSKLEDPAQIQQVRGVRGLDALVANTYRGSFLTEPDELKEHLDKCVQISRLIPIYNVQRPWGLAEMDNVNSEIEDHALRLMDAFRPNPEPMPKQSMQRG